MKKHQRYLTAISVILLAGFLFAGCASPSAAAPAGAASAQEPAFFSALAEMERQYGFGTLKALDLSAMDAFLAGKDGFQWQGTAAGAGVLEDVQLQQGDGLAIEFSFAQLPDAADAGWAFKLAPLAGGSSVLRFSADGLSAQLDGQQQNTAAFEPIPDWQPGVHYTAFLHLNTAGGLDLHLWETDQPGQVYTATLMDAYIGSANLAIELGAAQALIVYRVWKLENMVSSKEQAQISYDTYAAALAGYQIETTHAVDELVCDGQSVGNGDVFTWSAMTNVHCDLSLQMGQALAFNFVLANPANDWVRVTYVMLDANLEGSDMPVKNLGLALANDKAIVKQDYEELGSFEYTDGFELEAGVTYSAVILMNEQNGFEIEIWPMDYPDTRMSVVLDGSNVPPNWLPVDNEEWVFGIWLPEEQQLTISNLYQFSLKDLTQRENSDLPTEEATSYASEEIAGEAEWLETGNIPNLGDFYINDLTPYDQINCDDELKNTAEMVEFRPMAEDFTHNCQIDLAQNSGLIFEFTYSGENAAQQDVHLFDFAISSGEGEAQRVIRFIPGKNDLILKSNDQFVDSYRMEGQINWEPGRRYTMIFIPSFNKYIYVWPSRNPQQTLQINIDSGEWESYFGADDPQEPWQLRVWVAAEIMLQMENIYRFMAQ